MEVTSPRTLRVFYVITKATGGGAQKYVGDLVEEAKKRGCEPVLVYGQSGLLVDRVRALGSRTFQISALQRDISFFDEFRACHELIKLFKRERPDIVHLNSSKAGAIGAVAARLAQVRRIVFTVHGWAFTEPRPWYSKLFVLLSYYLTAMLCDVVITVSKKSGSYPKRWPFVAHKVRIIYNGIEIPSFLDRETAREQLRIYDPSLPKDGMWVGTIAELHRNKGLDAGIDAWKQAALKNADWVIIGNGEEHAALTTHAASVPTIHFIGFIPDASTFLRAFDIFMLPSRTEALAYVLLEAGAAGLPTIATQVGGVPEIIADKESGVLVPPNDPPLLTEALTYFATHSHEATAYGTALQRRITDIFLKNKMVEKTFDTYRA